MERLKNAIKEIVEDKQGIKTIELLVELSPQVKTTPTEKVIGAIDELVAAGELVEIEYILPAMTYRTKSFLFPKGTTMTVKGV